MILVQFIFVSLSSLVKLKVTVP